MTDAELIEACRRDDRRSQNELYRRYFPLMSSVAMRYTGSEEEAVQAINAGFLKVLTNLHRYDPGYAPATFIRSVLVNHLTDEYRKQKKRWPEVDISLLPENEAQVSLNLGEASLEAGELLAMLNELPETTRQVFNLFAIDGYRHHEIASMLGMAEGTSKWHVSEARRLLKLRLQQVNGQEKRNSKIAY